MAKFGVLQEVLELSPEESIQILEKAKEILGPNGENWTKSCWVAAKQDFEDGSVWDKELTWDESDEEDGQKRYCIMGAIEQAAYELGIAPVRQMSERWAKPISLQNLVSSREEWRSWGVIEVNDAEETTFETIRDLIDTRLAQLREET